MLLLDFPTNTGRPRYFSFIVSDLICSACITPRLSESFVLGLNITADLSALINCPDPSSYIARMSFSCCASAGFALHKMSESSAKSKCDTYGAALHIRMPWILPSSSALDSKAEKPSAHRRNRYGDIGSPWRSPRSGLNSFVNSPFTRILYLTVVTQVITKSTQVAWKPSRSIISFKKLHSTLS